MSILHEHKGGQQCEPHMRCEVVLGPTGPKVLIDLDMDLFCMRIHNIGLNPVILKLLE